MIAGEIANKNKTFGVLEKNQYEHADVVGYCYAQSADHVAMLQGELARRRDDWRRLGLVGKIERRAVRNLPEIIT